MINITEVLEAAKKYDENEKTKSERNGTNLRLKSLVKQYGIEAVSAASGLKPSSLIQYTTKTSSPKCSELAVKKAESILSQF